MRRRPRTRGSKNAVAALAVILAAIAGGTWTLRQQAPAPPGEVRAEAGRTVSRVLDGDTLKLDNGERVRLIGIDTPETHDNQKLSRDVARRGSGREAQLAMGRAAADFSRILLEGKSVRLEFDVETKDRYGRTLAYVYLSDGTFANEQIIRQGYAYPLTVPPNVRHAEDFQHWFEEAREQRRGLWR